MSECKYKCLVYHQGNLMIEGPVTRGSYRLDSDYIPVFYRYIQACQAVSILFYFHGRLIKRIDYMCSATSGNERLKFSSLMEEYYDLAAFA